MGVALHAESRAARAMQPRKTTKIPPEIDAASLKITAAVIRSGPSDRWRDAPGEFPEVSREKTPVRTPREGTDDSSTHGNPPGEFGPGGDREGMQRLCPVRLPVIILWIIVG